MGKDTSRGGRWRTDRGLTLALNDESGSLAYFNTSQSKTDTPTKFFLATSYLGATPTGGILSLHVPEYFKFARIKRIHYRLNPDNAVTYTLRLWESAVDPNYLCNQYLIYESPSGQVDDTDYDRAELDIPVRTVNSTTGNGSIIYYSIEFSAAQGSCVAGFIRVDGEVLE